MVLSRKSKRAPRLQEANERVRVAKEEASYEASKALEAVENAKQAWAQEASKSQQLAMEEAQKAVEVDDGPWQDVRHASLEEVKAELVRARGQVFKMQHEKDDLKELMKRRFRPRFSRFPSLEGGRNSLRKLETVGLRASKALRGAAGAGRGLPRGPSEGDELAEAYRFRTGASEPRQL